MATLAGVLSLAMAAMLCAFVVRANQESGESTGKSAEVKRSGTSG